MRAAQHAEQQRDAVTDGEQRHVGDDLAQPVEEEDDAEQEQQVVVARDHVQVDTYGIKLHAGRALDEPAIVLGHAVCPGGNAEEQEERQRGRGEHPRWGMAFRLHCSPASYLPDGTTALAVIVPVVQVGIMRMAVRQPAVSVRMRVRLLPVPREAVAVLVMLVVHVRVRVLQRLVHVRVLVALGQVKPHAERHQPGRDPERGRRRLAQHEQGERGAEERRHREVGPVRAVPRWRSARTKSTRLMP